MEAILTYAAHTFTINKAKAILSILLSWASFLVWGINAMIQALYLLLILDFILWFSIAFFIKHDLSKKKFQLWLTKFILYWVALIVFNLTDILVWHVEIFGVWIREIWVSYLWIGEALSCLRHLGDLWVPIPKKLIQKLENYRDNLDTTYEGK